MIWSIKYIFNFPCDSLRSINRRNHPGMIKSKIHNKFFMSNVFLYSYCNMEKYLYTHTIDIFVKSNKCIRDLNYIKRIYIKIYSQYTSLRLVHIGFCDQYKQCNNSLIWKSGCCIFLCILFHVLASCFHLIMQPSLLTINTLHTSKIFPIECDYHYIYITFDYYKYIL